MPKSPKTTPRPALVRNRPAINFTTAPELHKLAEDVATTFGLFTAQGGDERPRVSAVLNGLLLLLKQKQIPMSTLYDAACEATDLEPDLELRKQLGRRVAA